MTDMTPAPALCYPQKPLCPSAVPASVIQKIEAETPMGQNMVICVCPYTGCNRSCFYEL